MRRRYLLITCCLSLLLFHLGAAQKIQFELVTPPKDDVWGRIRGIVQDAQGFLWIATTSGLYKYDGHKATAYHYDPSDPNGLADDWIESIGLSKAGFLLLGTFGAGLDRLDLVSGKVTHYSHSQSNNTLSNDTITAIVGDKDGFFWIGTHNGLNRFDPKSGNFTRYLNNPADPTSLSDNQVRTLYIDQAGTLWVGTRSPWVHDGGTRVGGLNRFIKKTGKFARYLHDPKSHATLIDNSVSAIFEDSRGTFWVGTAGDGLHTMNRSAGTFERHRYDPSRANRLSRPPLLQLDTTYLADFINFISEDPQGRIWIGTVNGLNVYDPKTRLVSWYNPSRAVGQSINENGVSTTFTSADGVFWIGGYDDGALFKVNPYSTSLSHVALGVRANDFVQEANGTLWIATMKGLLRKGPNNSVKMFVPDKGFQLTKAMYAIVADRHQKLWIGTLGGLLQFDPVDSSFVAYRQQSGNPNSLLCDSVYTLTIDQDYLWIGTIRGLDRLHLDTKQFTHYSHNPNDTNSLRGITFNDEGVATVLDILIDQNQQTWVCAGGAINRLDRNTGRFKRFLTGGVYAICVKVASDGSIWAGTGSGLYRYDTGQANFVFVTDPLRLINRTRSIHRIVEDREKNLWLKTHNGFIKYNVKRNEASLFENNGTSFSGYIIKSRGLANGQILSGDSTGFFIFHPDSLLKAKPPQIVFTGFTLLNKRVIPGSGGPLVNALSETSHIHLKHNENIFSFDFTNIDFTSGAEDRHLLYKLENYETKWHNADAEGTVDYYNIPSGSYVFRVKAVGSSGIWGEKELFITVALPWWRTWWAYSLYALIFILAVYLVHRFQKQRLLARERERARERELAQAKEIEKAYADLKTTQKQLIQKEKMASLGELTAGIAHEIQNPLNFVNNFSAVNKELVSELKQEAQTGHIAEVLFLAAAIEENEEKIAHHGRRADAIVKSMLQHSRGSSGQKQNTKINQLVEECLRLSYHGFQVKNNSFTAVVKTDLSEQAGELSAVPQEIGRVLVNLFNNAFYAVSEKKKVLNGTFEPCVQVSTKREGGQVAILVRDNGTGMSPQIADKVFQPFFTTKPTGEGTGLGLSLSYDIVKAHGGELKVKSIEGEETEFTVILNQKQSKSSSETPGRQ